VSLFQISDFTDFPGFFLDSHFLLGFVVFDDFL
jgi:hypothetical protein